ncbi:SdiA-regulated domain-containing protein [Spirosoma sp. RP8]|uniref:SdiA-regulated domain-containing protein n=1 Tax=Spirosoma liriopis TaxID=2937440 RepID=A0ABT0HFF8_9BACT|nr:SdiA-regulated domain-containing protein [Spirosoma liriopis]MCK8490355.1 SdiA-regulated domain-containing protein [Spirosoma liriopis]
MNRIITGIMLLLVSCGPSSETKKSAEDTPEAGKLAASFTLPYRLTAPDETYTLPKALEEISGLTYYKNDQLLCVQDEEAVVYVFDTKKKAVVKDFGFGGYGDFEGIEYVNDEVYVLESNGNLFRFKPESTQIGRTKTDLPKKTEVEGLGYDPKTKRLLIAVKNGGPSSDKTVYSFNLLNKAVFKDMSLNDEQLEGAGIDPKSYKPSGIAVHPITGEWYILTSAGKRLLITNRQAKIIYSEPLDPKQYRQPEGICFAPNGDLFIASEGNGKKGYIMKFAYKK